MTSTFSSEQHQTAMLCVAGKCITTDYSPGEHHCISPHVLAYAQPAGTDFIARLIRAVEIANGLTPVAKIRVSSRLSKHLGLYYHKGVIAIARDRVLPTVAMHELGHHWHFSEGNAERDYKSHQWRKQVNVNDIANNYERKHVVNVKERIAECFSLYMIDPSCLSEEKQAYFHSQGLQSHAGPNGWRKQLELLKDVPLENLVDARNPLFRKVAE